MAFTDIPIRSNGEKIKASWFNTIRSELITSGTTQAALRQYISDSAYASSNAVVNGSIYYNTTIDKARIYQAGMWANLGGDTSLVIEVPTGNVNGVNKSFNVTNSVIGGVVDLSINGVRLKPADYSYSSPTITLVTAPAIGQEVVCSYLTTGAVAAIVTQEEINQVVYHTLNGGEITAKQITLLITPAVANKVIVDIVEGVPQEYAVDYTVSSNILSWNGLGLDGVLDIGDVLRIQYFS